MIGITGLVFTLTSKVGLANTSICPLFEGDRLRFSVIVKGGSFCHGNDARW